jgi:ribosomal protein L7/L12
VVQVRITGWRPGLNKVALTKALQAKLGWGLAAAKHATDDVLEGKAVSFDVGDEVTAPRIAATLRDLGAQVSVAPREPLRNVAG